MIFYCVKPQYYGGYGCWMLTLYLTQIAAISRKNMSSVWHVYNLFCLKIFNFLSGQIYVTKGAAIKFEAYGYTRLFMFSDKTVNNLTFCSVIDCCPSSDYWLAIVSRACCWDCVQAGRVCVHVSGCESRLAVTVSGCSVLGPMSGWTLRCCPTSHQSIASCTSEQSFPKLGHHRLISQVESGIT